MNSFPNRFRGLPLHRRLRLLVAVLVTAVLGIIALYWYQAESSYAKVREDVLLLADRQAEQLADAVARQADDLVRGIDASLLHMRQDYLANPRAFVDSVQLTLNGYPEGVILNISVFDGNGVAIYNVSPSAARIYGGDRDYFRKHEKSASDRIYVGQAIFGRVSKVWAVPFSRKLVRNGRFVGVIVVFVRADYLNQMLARIARHTGDVISLFTQDGAYVSRSADMENAMGKKVPLDRPFLGPDAPQSGVFRAVAAYDKRPRIYGWSRLDGQPLVVNVGLDASQILAPIEGQIGNNRRINVFGSISILLGLTVTVVLLLRVAQQQRRIAESEASLRISKIAVDTASDGIIVTDAENRILMVNPAFSQITGYSQKEVIGLRPSILSSGHQDREFYAAMWKSLNTLGHWEGEVTNRTKSGQLYVEWLKINVIDKDDPAQRRHVAVVSDITARKKSEELIWRRANYDELTGLPNRRLVLDRLDQALARATRSRTMLAVLFIDLDEFKPVNDEYGHQAGDDLLKQVAKRMSLCLREEDTVARQGGDEFVVLLATISFEIDALQVAEKLLETLHAPFQVGENFVKIGASIGVAVYPMHATTAAALLERADNAMYEAKSAGRHTVRLCTANQASTRA